MRKQPSLTQLRRWLKTAKSLQKRSVKMVDQMFDHEPECSFDAELSDYAVNVTVEIDNLVDVLEQGIKKHTNG